MRLVCIAVVGLMRRLVSISRVSLMRVLYIAVVGLMGALMLCLYIFLAV